MTNKEIKNGYACGLILNSGSYLFLLDFISLMLNDTLDSDQVVIVDERLFAIFLFFLLFLLAITKLITLAIGFHFLFALFLGCGCFLLLGCVLGGCCLF